VGVGVMLILRDAAYLAALCDPKHEQHIEMLEWRGPFDPDAFDAKKATKEIKPPQQNLWVHSGSGR